MNSRVWIPDDCLLEQALLSVVIRKNGAQSLLSMLISLGYPTNYYLSSQELTKYFTEFLKWEDVGKSDRLTWKSSQK
jgi:hypothetical protein